MFCRNCGRQIPERSQFCNYCGTVQGSAQPQADHSNVLYLLAVIILAVSLTMFMAKQNEKPKTISSGGSSRPASSSQRQEPVQNTPSDGWFKQGGKTYYYEGGEKCVGMIEIGGQYYYFDETGALKTNTTVDTGNLIIRVDSKGRVTEVCYPEIQGQWGSKPYTYGNGGQATAMEFRNPVEDVTSLKVYIQASGLYGSIVDGEWKLLLRINGQWVEQGYFEYSGGYVLVNVPLDHPTTIEAVTAHPTKTGNASYEAYFELRDVWCEFS